MTVENAWYLVSSHGAILMLIAVTPGITIKEIADTMNLTRRTVWGTVGDLRRADLLHVRKEGRRHHYTLDPEGLFKHPTILQNVKVGDIFGKLAKECSKT